MTGRKWGNIMKKVLTFTGVLRGTAYGVYLNNENIDIFLKELFGENEFVGKLKIEIEDFSEPVKIDCKN